jgi:hypothetical protein
MRQYRLTVFEPARSVDFDFEAESDRDAVQLTSAAAAGHDVALWRDGRLLLRLQPLGLKAGDGLSSAR